MSSSFNVAVAVVNLNVATFNKENKMKGVNLETGD